MYVCDMNGHLTTLAAELLMIFQKVLEVSY